MKFLDAINKAYEQAHVYGKNPTRIFREDASDGSGEAKVYADGVCSFFWDEISVDDVNAEDWHIEGVWQDEED